jgi:GGDEF domain-containing protein
MLLLPHTSSEGAQEYCRRLRAELEQLPPGLPATWRLHTSFGIAGYSSAYRTPKSLLRLAEEQLAPGAP